MPRDAWYWKMLHRLSMALDRAGSFLRRDDEGVGGGMLLTSLACVSSRGLQPLSPDTWNLDFDT